MNDDTGYGLQIPGDWIILPKENNLNLAKN